MSGPAAGWGKAIDRGVRTAAALINEGGGLKIGTTTYTIEVVTGDTKCNRPEAVKVMNKLVFQDRIRFVVGPICSAEVLAMQTVTEPNQVLVIGNGYAKEILAANKPFYFRGIEPSHERAPSVVAWLRKNRPEIKTVVTVAPNDASGWSVTKDYEEPLGKAGLNLAAKEFYERGTTDFYPMLTRIKAKNADLIFSTGATPAEYALVVKQARELGLKAVLGGHCGSVSDIGEFVRIAGPANAEGYLFCHWPDLKVTSPNPKAVRFMKKATALFGNEVVPGNDGIWYDAMNAMAHAMRKAGSLDPAKVRDALTTIPDWADGVMTSFKLGGKDYYGIDRQAISHAFIVTIKQGEPVWLYQVRP
jgi:branched-chain amino acid transport system substrate-binding protein